MLRRNIYEHNAKIYRARKEGRSSPQRRSHLVVLTLRNLSPNRSQKRPIYHLNCESQARFVLAIMRGATWKRKERDGVFKNWKCMDRRLSHHSCVFLWDAELTNGWNAGRYDPGRFGCFRTWRDDYCAQCGDEPTTTHFFESRGHPSA